MDEEIKVNFSKPMLVLKIRDTYKAPYHKNKFLNINKKNIDSKTGLKKFLQQYTINWSSGTYDIQFVLVPGDYFKEPVYSTLMRFDVRDGKVVKVWKASPYSKREYPIWEYLKSGRKKRSRARKRKAKLRKALKKGKKKVSKKKVKK